MQTTNKLEILEVENSDVSENNQIVLAKENYAQRRAPNPKETGILNLSALVFNPRVPGIENTSKMTNRNPTGTWKSVNSAAPTTTPIPAEVVVQNNREESRPKGKKTAEQPSKETTAQWVHKELSMAMQLQITPHVKIFNHRILEWKEIWQRIMTKN